MVTKMDIAKALSISRTSVTQVLNQAPNARISESTRRTILEQARKMGYTRPAKKPELKTSPMITYMICGVENIDGNYLSHLDILQKLAMLDDRVTVFMTTTNEIDSVEHTLHSIDNIRPLGVVLDGRVSDLMLAELQKRDIPFVVAGSTRYAYEDAFAGKINTVGVDVKGAIRELMRWFHAKGASRISISIGPLKLLVHDMILDAYKRALAELDIAYDPSLVQIGEESDGREIIERLGRLGISYDAILLGSSNRALRTMPYLRAAGEGVRNKNLIGIYSPVEYARSFPDDVTICGSPLADIAKATYELLAKEINYTQSKKQNLIVPYRMCEGLSSHLR